MIVPMWVTVLHVLEWPAAIFCGYAIGKVARGLRLPLWLAYCLALAIGALISVASSALAPPRQETWQGILIWASWAAFGIVQGSRAERPAHSLTTLNLSGKNR